MVAGADERGVGTREGGGPVEDRVGACEKVELSMLEVAADFGITAVAGVLAGAFAWAVASRSLKAEGFDTPGHLARYALGGALMGFGGVLALGCTVGAGLTGMSTLSLGSLIALASIVSGGAIGHFVKTRVVGGRSPEIVPAE